MKNQSRRDFFKLTGAAIAGSALARNANAALPVIPGQEKERPLKLGMASYTLREFDLDKTIAITKKVALDRIALKSFHLPLNASDDDILQVRQQVTDAGLELYGGGVIYMENEKAVKNAFHYAQTAGMSVIIGVPEHDLLELVEEHVKDTGIKLAIHNHGPGDERYPSPESAYTRVENLDPRMGLCIDIGHTKRLGQNPAKEFKRFQDRVFDIHLKDVDKAEKEGKTVELGRGVIDIPEFIRTVADSNYNGTMALEFEKDGKDPLPGIAESIGYACGVIDSL